MLIQLKSYISNLHSKLKTWFSKLHSFAASNIYIHYILLSFVTMFVVECFNRRSVLAAFRFLCSDFPAFSVGFFIVLTTLSLTHVCKKRNFYKCFLSLVWVILSLVSFIVFAFRLLPFNFNDILALGGTFTILPKYLSAWHIIIIAVAFVLLLLVVIWFYRKTESVSINLKKDVIFPVCMLVFTLMYFFFARFTGVVDNKITGLTNKYERNGFAYCFTCSVFERGMREPTDYSSVEVASIVNDVNSNVSPKKNKPNIIFLQLESFFDVNNIKEFSYSENPVTNFNLLEEKFSHGYLNVPTFSSGTANTEFEVLSGMNVDFLGIGEIAYQSVVGKKPIETVCHILKNQGYTTHAIHNNNASFYKRNEIYKSLGFDTFTSLEYMYDVEYNTLGWARDKVLTTSIGDCLNSTDGTDMIYAVGVQAHGTYSPGLVDSAPIIDVTGIENPSTEKSYEYYISQIKEVDNFIGELISSLENRNEPTMLVIFGDHMPGFQVEDEELLNDSKYQTQYVMWSNFSHDFTIKNLHSYQLYSYVLDRLNIEGGTISKLHKQHEYTASEEYMQKFELIQYDMLEGEGISYMKRSPFYVDTKMGIRPIEAKKAFVQDGNLIVEGKNFNQFSSVEYDGTLLDTEFVDASKIIVRDFVQKERINKISVVQADDNSYVLSSTKPVTLK